MKYIGLLLTCVLASQYISAQSVGINANGAIPDPSAILDLSDTTKGFLMPRMTIAQRNAIPDPAAGLIIYQTDSLTGHYVFNGEHWNHMMPGGGSVDDALQVGVLDSTETHIYHMTDTSLVIDTTGILYDSGGPDQNYANSEDITFHIYQVTGAIGVRIRMIYYQTESPYDSLTIESQYLAEEGRYVFSGSGENIVLPILHGSIGGIAIRFKSNAVNTQPGFALRWDWIFPDVDNDQPPPNTGWYFSPAKMAMRGGVNIANAWDQDSLGLQSLAWGEHAIASGEHSIALGFMSRAGAYATSLGVLSKASGSQSFCVGSSVASGNFSTAIGTYCQALDEHSVAIGRGAITSGRRAVSLGHNNTASGFGSVAFGIESVASGHGALAMGSRTRAKGPYASTSGYFTQANGYSSFVIGQFNDTLVAPQNSINTTTPLFIIGNGSSMTSRSNAFVVRYDGTVGIGASIPSELLQVGTTTGDGIRIGSYEVLSDAGATMLQVNAAFIPEVDNTFDLGTSARRWDDVWATNGVIQTSDARDKENITELESGLETLMQLRPVRYQWKEGPDRSFQIGLLAQEVQDVIPGVVRSTNFIYHEDGTITEEPTERLGMNYSALIPVLINAARDLHAENTALRADLEKLGAENAVLKQSLESRLSAVEAEIKALERK